MNQMNLKFKIIASFSLFLTFMLFLTYVMLNEFQSLFTNDAVVIYFLFMLLGLMLIALYFGMALYYSLVDMFQNLESAFNKIARGDASIYLQNSDYDEVGRAIAAFNRMSYELDSTLSFLDRYKMAIDESSIVSKTDEKGVITYANRLFCEISGYSNEELIGEPHNIVRHPDMPKEAFREMWKTIKSKKVWRGVVKNRKKSGDTYIVDATIIPVLGSDGYILEYIAVRHDVTELHKSKEEIAKQKIDYLTKLPNKHKLYEDIYRIERPIIFYFNIDDFMKLNDFYGNRIGDRVLINMAKLLDAIAKEYGCQAYRVHNDEFVLLCAEGKINIANYQGIFREIINNLEESTISCNTPGCVSFTVSGGISSYDLDDKYENLPLYASIACNIAKKQRKKLLVFKHEMRKEEDYANNIEWIQKIKYAIAKNRFVPYFQPIMDNKTGKISKYESLIRMIDESGDVVSPYLFLEIAKRAKLYSKITRTVIDQTLQLFWHYPSLECSINLSTEDIVDKETRAYIYNCLKNYPHPQNIVFEITESEEIKDFNIVNTFIKRVRSYGVQISIDDFGTGYANFDYILNLDIDYLKIDGSLIRHLDTDHDSKIITEAIILFSKKLGTKTIVEYVHSQDIQDEVLRLGADYSQGYFIGEPQSTIEEQEGSKLCQISVESV